MLASHNSKLSLKLVTVIKQRQQENKWGNLPELIYESKEPKHRLALNQLASYTFKQSFYLALNYPTYLLPNVSLLLQKLNAGALNEANFLADVLLDIAEKTEDFTTQKFVLQIKFQQAYLVKELSRGNKFHQQMMQVMESEKLLHEIYFILRKNFNVNSEKTVTSDEVRDHLIFFNRHISNSVRSVSLLSRYAVLYIKYYFLPGDFHTDETLQEIKEFEHDLAHHSYLVFPPLLDLMSNVNFLKLNSTFINLDSPDGKRDYQMMQQHYTKVNFWKNYVNIPEIFSLTVKATFYLSKYSHRIHSCAAVDIEKDKEEIETVKTRCSEMLRMPLLSEKMFVNDHLNLSVTYSGMLLLGNKRDIKQAVGILEDLLFSYQQVNITASLDSIFVCMMFGYFALQEYETCAKTFVRYSKISKGKPIYEDNDLCIHVLYYMSQWLASERKQYINKLLRCKQQSLEHEHLNGARKLIEQMELDFGVNLSVANAA